MLCLGQHLQDGPGEVADHVVVLAHVEDGGRVQVHRGPGGQGSKVEIRMVFSKNVMISIIHLSIGALTPTMLSLRAQYSEFQLAVSYWGGGGGDWRRGW